MPAVFGNAHSRQGFEGFLFCGLGAEVGAVATEGFEAVVADGHQGIEPGHWVLEN